MRSEKRSPEKNTAASRKKRGGKSRGTDKQAANHDLETKLWTAADKLRGHMDAG